MKKRTHEARKNFFDIQNRRVTLIQAAIFAIATFLLEFLTGFVLYSVTKNAIFSAWNEQSALLVRQESATFSDKIEQLMQSARDGEAGAFDLTAQCGENGLTIESETYPISSAVTLERLLSGGIQFYRMSEISSAAPQGEVYAIVSVADGRSARLYCARLSGMLPHTEGRFVRYGIVSQSGRIVTSDDFFGGALKDYGVALPVSSQTDPLSIQVGEGRYSLRLCDLAQTDYAFYAVGDIGLQSQLLHGYLGNIAAIYSASAILILVISILCFAFLKRGAGSGLSRYRLQVEESGKIVKANDDFVRDFPDTAILMENAAAFDSQHLNAVNVTDKDGRDKLLVCRAKRNGTGKIRLNGDVVLGVSCGQDSVEEASGDCAALFEGFRKEGLRVLVGKIYAGNLKNIETMFGVQFAREAWGHITRKARLKFCGVFEAASDVLGVIFPDRKDLDAFIGDLADVMQLLDEPIRIGENLVHAGVKGGFAVADAAMRDKDFAYALTAAEGALKRACGDSKRYYVYHESQKKQYAKYFRTYDISKMLAEGAFYLEYQPQYSVTDRRICGFEALFRIKPTGEGEISVFDVITYAERSGKMLTLGAFIFDTAMRFAKTIESTGVTLSLNVSPIQLMQAGFVDSFLQCYDRYGLKDGAICVEITESFLMTTFDETLQKLELLRKRGILVHLDDFGTRYSSFLYLKRLPIAAIKIDKEFVDDITTNAYSRAIAGMVISITRELGLESIAEGVERLDQYRVLRELGVDVVQGYLIGKSMSESAAVAAIEKGVVIEEEKE